MMPMLLRGPYNESPADDSAAALLAPAFLTPAEVASLVARARAADAQRRAVQAERARQACRWRRRGRGGDGSLTIGGSRER